jgi:hypothetical protein
MLHFLRENLYQQGCCDRQAGLLPRMQKKVYLEGYFKDRPEGLDTIIQYFPSTEEYLIWRARASKNSGSAER